MSKSMAFLLCLGALMGEVACTPTKPVARASDADEEPAIQILAAEIDRTMDDFRNPKNTVVFTGPSTVRFKKANIVAEGEGDKRFTVYVTTDPFPPELGGTLVIKVKDKVFVPHSYGGDSKAYWSLELRNVDGKYAEVLNGGPLPKAPKDSFTIEFTPNQQTYPTKGPVEVGIAIKNIGNTATTIFWGTHGGGNYPCRDTQLSFTATLDGVPVPPNPKPLPDGFISSPYIAKPSTVLKRTTDLTQWLEFGKPGKYLISATHTLIIENPENGGTPNRWTATYHNQFPIQIRE